MAAAEHRLLQPPGHELSRLQPVRPPRRRGHAAGLAGELRAAAAHGHRGRALAAGPAHAAPQLGAPGVRRARPARRARAAAQRARHPRRLPRAPAAAGVLSARSDRVGPRPPAHRGDDGAAAVAAHGVAGHGRRRRRLRRQRRRLPRRRTRRGRGGRRRRAATGHGSRRPARAQESAHLRVAVARGAGEKADTFDAPTRDDRSASPPPRRGRRAARERLATAG